MNSQKGFAPLIIIVIVVAILGLGGTAFLLTKSRSLQSQLTNTKEDKAKIETELVTLKARDLIKENEILQLKLEAAGKNLSEAQKEIGRLTNFEANAKKTKPYLDAIEAVHNVFFGGNPTASAIATIDTKIFALKSDTTLFAQWEDAKRGIDTVRMSWDGNRIGYAIRTIMLRINNFLTTN